MNGGLIKSCELVARVRSGRVVKAGSNGVVLYNAKWLEQHAELRGSGVWKRVETSLYVCSLCKKVMPEGTEYCPWCGAKMESEGEHDRQDRY